MPAHNYVTDNVALLVEYKYKPSLIEPASVDICCLDSENIAGSDEQYSMPL